jgi:hypothetical protein
MWIKFKSQTALHVHWLPTIVIYRFIAGVNTESPSKTAEFAIQFALAGEHKAFAFEYYFESRRDGIGRPFVA